MQDFDRTELHELSDKAKECPKCGSEQWMVTYYPEQHYPDRIDVFGHSITKIRTIPCWGFRCRMCGHIWDWQEDRNAKAATIK